ncbi:hypothetical protein [Granulicella sp. dw_53]|uniref:hypothetical protein n=1 Tax=Granulicella sp. dw_53 TaxID=2719792 RepID=UPI001BD24036|nr:hypothetical protein [Granulicella sp. dw_53]
MFFRARRALQRARFNFQCRALLDTPPLHADTGVPRVALVSMICHGEVIMYLLAVKTFCRKLGRNPSIVLLDDGSLTKDDYAAIAHHLPEATIVHISKIAKADCPTGSCWERLLLISDLVQDSYVIQIDSDTLTLNSIPEINDCISSNRSFTLMGDRSFPEIESMTSASARSKGNTNHMVQAVCERSFDQLPESVSLNYVRGNAGFAGFASGSFDRQRVEFFSNLMRRIAKEKWDEWGSEQVTSSLLIANTKGAYALSFPKYLSYWAHPDVDYTQASFIHFIGPHRYDNGFYLKSAKKMIALLKG